MSIPERINAVRTQMAEKGLKAYVVLRTDPHQSEYLSDHWELVAWISGFTGSAATLVITDTFAGVWTDSRYFLQANDQLQGTGIELQKLKTPHVPEFIDWLTQELNTGDKVGLDGQLCSYNSFKQLKEKLKKNGIILEAFHDLVTHLWADRPALPSDQVELHPARFAGAYRIQKMTQVRDIAKSVNADYELFAALDDIAWLLNIRGRDTDFTPVVNAYLLMGAESGYLFIDKLKINEKVSEELAMDRIQVLPYTDVFKKLQELTENKRIVIDPKLTNMALCGAVNESASIQYQENSTILLKAQKNETELNGFRKAMVNDGVAMFHFFRWLKVAIAQGEISEIDASSKLNAFRAEQENYVGESFAAISGYKEHGAIVHYKASKASASVLKPEGMYLLDSGAQYLHGTTDITRTVCLGTPTENEKRDFTLVLKGHIQLAMAKFPKGTKGYQVDILARKALWQHGFDYGHGTGHGVGSFLGVHEGPQRISQAANSVALLPGMVISNEPGVYRTGEYGIRIENLIVVVEDSSTDFGEFYKFETITLYPIELQLIEKSLLSVEETDWLNSYHSKVYEQLSPNLNEEEAKWLKELTKAI